MNEIKFGEFHCGWNNPICSGKLLNKIREKYGYIVYQYHIVDHTSRKINNLLRIKILTKLCHFYER